MFPASSLSLIMKLVLVVVNGGFLVAGQKSSLLHPVFIFPRTAFLKDMKDFGSMKCCRNAYRKSRGIGQSVSVCISSHFSIWKLHNKFNKTIQIFQAYVKSWGKYQTFLLPVSVL